MRDDRAVIFAEFTGDRANFFSLLIKQQGLSVITRTFPSFRIQFIIMHDIHTETNPEEIMIEFTLEHPPLKVRSAANIVTRTDKALHRETPRLPTKSRSGSFIVNF